MNGSIRDLAAVSLCAALASIAVARVEAATIERGFYQNGGSACTGALPTFEGALRKRPKAIANEGDSAAFVTCSAVSNSLNSAKPKRVFVYATNRGAGPVDLTCTFVNGDEFFGSEATPKTATLPVGGLRLIEWLPVAPATTFERDTVSVSCSLPPGVEINLFGQRIDEDIGA